MGANSQLRAEMGQARDVGTVVNAISDLTRSFGEIRRWSFCRDRETGELTVFIMLGTPELNATVARALGGTIADDQIRFLIPPVWQERPPSAGEPPLSTHAPRTAR